MTHFLIDISSASLRPTGIGTYVHELVRRLIHLPGDHRITLLMNSLRQPAPPWATSAPPDRVQLVRRSIPGPLLLESWRHFQRPNAETLAARSPFGPPDLVFSPASFIPPRQSCLGASTVHDLSYLHSTPASDPQPPLTLSQRIAHRTGPSYLKWSLTHLVPQLDLAFCISNATARALRAHLESATPATAKPLPEIIVTPLGVSPDFRPSPEPTARPYLFHIGGPHPRKDLPTLLEAVEIFLHSLPANPHETSAAPSPILILAGFPPDQLAHPSPLPPPLQNLPPLSSLPPPLAARYPLAAAHTAILGFVDQPTLNRLYSNALALVFPSIEEGYGLPVLEALACHCPVVASDTVAVLEHLPADAALTIQPRNPQQLAHHLSTLLTPGFLRSNYLDLNHLTWDRTAELTLDALISVTNG